VILPATEGGQPILRVRGSGHGGSGYKIPTDGNRVVAGVTTITGAADKPGLRQWVADNTAAFAVANVDALLNRSETEGYGFLRWRWKNEPKLDSDPDLRNWHGYVLNDAADLGTWFHNYAESMLLGEFPEREPEADWQYELAEQFELFLAEHDVEPIFTEQTVYNPVGYAGTLDLLARIDGVPTLCDWKTSRRVQDAHLQQLGALGAAPVWLRRVNPLERGNYMWQGGDPVVRARIEEQGDSSYQIMSWFGEEVNLDIDGEITTINGSFVLPLEDAVAYKRKDKPTTWWMEDVVPEFSRYAILQFRPTDDDGTPAYYDIHYIDPQEIALHYEAFLGYLTAKEAERKVKQYTNSKEEK